jgi:hypothetical protein
VEKEIVRERTREYAAELVTRELWLGCGGRLSSPHFEYH